MQLTSSKIEPQNILQSSSQTRIHILPGILSTSALGSRFKRLDSYYTALHWWWQGQLERMPLTRWEHMVPVNRFLALLCSLSCSVICPYLFSLSIFSKLRLILPYSIYRVQVQSHYCHCQKILFVDAHAWRCCVGLHTFVGLNIVAL